MQKGVVVLKAELYCLSCQGSRRDQKILEEGGGAGLDLQVSPEEIMSIDREVEHEWSCVCIREREEVVKTPEGTSRWAMPRGHRLNTSIVLAEVHGLSGLFRAVSAVEPSLFRPLPPLSPSLISHLASVDLKQNGPSWLSELRSCVKVEVAVLGSRP